MKIGRRTALLGLGFVSSARAQEADLRALARRAAIYLAPLYAAYLRRHLDVVVRGQKLNKLARRLSPPNDALIATAWLDLSSEPMFLTAPAMQGRRYRIELLDPFLRSFAQMSGSTPRPWIVGGPAWNREAPIEADAVRAPAKSVWLRYALTVHPKEEDDVGEARGLQARTLLETPDERNQRRILEMQELMRYRTYAPPEPVADWPAPRPGDRFDLFEVGSAMLGECVLSEYDRQMLETLAPLRLRPGRHFDARALSETEREAIASGIEDAAPQIAAAKALTDWG